MAIPTLVQHSSYSSVQGNPVTVCHFPLPNIVLSGNAIFVFLNQASGSAVPTVTDDKSNTYTRQAGPDDSSQRLDLWYCLNVTNGPRIVTVTYGTAAPYVNSAISEYYNIATSAAFDTKQTGSGSGTALSLGTTLTTATADELILVGGVQTSTATTSTSWVAGTGFTLTSGDVLDQLGTEMQIKASAGTITSGTTLLTLAPTNNWICGAWAFKNATAGTAPGSGIRIRSYQRHSLHPNNLGYTSPRTLMAPCAGNLLIGTWQGTAGMQITSITDTNSNTWVQVPNSPLASVQAGEQQIFYVASPVVSANMTLTLTFGGSPTSGQVFHFLDIVNGHTSPLDTTTVLNGAEEVEVTWQGGSITPSTDNGLIIIAQGVESNTVLSNSPGWLMASTNPVEEVSPWPNDQNNGPGIYYNPNTNTFTSQWVADGPPGDWGELLAAFIAAPPVTVSNVTPDEGQQGATALELTLTGTRFTGV